MTDTIIMPKSWFVKGTFIKLTVTIEDGAVKKTLTEQRFFDEKPLSRNAKLTYAQADEIRDEFARGDVTKAALSRKYNVSKRTIGRIISKERYS